MVVDGELEMQVDEASSIIWTEEAIESRLVFYDDSEAMACDLEFALTAAVVNAAGELYGEPFQPVTFSW